MNTTDLLSAINLLFEYYSNNTTILYHLLRSSINPNIVNIDNQITILLSTMIIDGNMTQNDISIQFNSDIADNVSRINQYSDESDYTYVDRINSDETLSIIRYCLLEDDYYISSFNSNYNLINANNNKSLLNMNFFKGQGIHTY